MNTSGFLSLRSVFQLMLWYDSSVRPQPPANFVYFEVQNRGSALGCLRLRSASSSSALEGLIERSLEGLRGGFLPRGGKLETGAVGGRESAQGIANVFDK